MVFFCLEFSIFLASLKKLFWFLSVSPRFHRTPVSVVSTLMKHPDRSVSRCWCRVFTKQTTNQKTFMQVLLAKHRTDNKFYAVKVLQKKIILKKKEVFKFIIWFTVTAHPALKQFKLSWSFEIASYKSCFWHTHLTETLLLSLVGEEQSKYLAAHKCTESYQKQICSQIFNLFNCRRNIIEEVENSSAARNFEIYW